MADIVDVLSRPVPKDRYQLLKLTRDAWEALARTVATFHERSEQDARALASALCRWRYTLAVMRMRDEEDTAAAYLVEAGVRLALLDWLHVQTDPEQAASAVIRNHRLAPSERGACSQVFKPIGVGEIETYVRSVSSAWTQPGSEQREVEQLPRLAHAVLIVFEGAQSPSARSLIAASRIGILCTQRALLRDLARCERSSPPENSANVRAWVEKRIAAPKSDAATKGHSDAMALDDLDPLSLPASDTASGFSAIATASAVAFLLTLQPSEVASRAAEKARAWGTPATQRQWTIVAMSIFDYACRQSHGYQWAAAFTTSDARPGAALERVRRYKEERMADPPPLILLVDDDCVLLQKGFHGVRAVGRFSGTDGLAAWVEASLESMEQRLGAVMRDANAGGETGAAKPQEHALPLIPLRIA